MPLYMTICVHHSPPFMCMYSMSLPMLVWWLQENLCPCSSDMNKNALKKGVMQLQRVPLLESVCGRARQLQCELGAISL